MRGQLHRRQRWLPRAARYLAEELLDQRTRLDRIEVAGDRQHGVVRGVVRREKLRDVFEAGVGEILHRANERVMEGVVRRKRERRQPLPPRAIGLIVHAPAALVLHDIALRVQLLLRHRRKQLSHAIRFEPERGRQLVRWHRLEVVRAVEPGRAVQRATGALHDLEVLIRTHVRGPLKEHVLEEVGESGAPGTFVGRTDVVPEIHGHDRRRVVLGERYRQAVRQPERHDGYSHCSNLH